MSLKRACFSVCAIRPKYRKTAHFLAPVPLSCYIYFMIIEQTIEIPPANGYNRQLTIDVPREMPEGAAQVIIRFPASAVDEARRRQYMTAIETCCGLGRRMGARLTSDDFLERRHKDREREDARDALHTEGRRDGV
jgi:hypothetical protein